MKLRVPDFVYLAIMKHFLTLVLFFALVCPVGAQSDCGTVMPPAYYETARQRATQVQPTVFSGGLIIVPVHIHLLRESNGNSALTLQNIQTELDSVNYYYENAGLIFIECIAAEMIDDDSMYDYESSTDQADLLTNHFTPNVINLYFGNTVSLNGSPVCGYAWFPGGPDACFISGACATNGSTLAHELGHYMGLMHTHGGSSDELVDGSNCSSEGDLICDTPADPGLSGLVDTACMYTGTSVDANSMAYQPDVSNIMSYSRKVCRISFTPLQYAMINYTYWNDRTYLQCISTGMSETPAIDVRVFPNPAQNELRVLFNDPGVNRRIEIYDATGRLVLLLQVADGTPSQIVDLSSLANGAYVCKVVNGTQEVTAEQFVIAR
jgi:hypothetical protein